MLIPSGFLYMPSVEQDFGFIFKVNTSNYGTSDSRSFGITTFTNSSPLVINWGDGVLEVYDPSTLGIFHTYNFGGEYTISFKGILDPDMPFIYDYYYGSNTSDYSKITEIVNFGKHFTVRSNTFNGANNGLLISDTKQPIIDTNLDGTFANSYVYGNLNWDTSHVTSMVETFAYNFINESSIINNLNFNTSSVIDMGGMFYAALIYLDLSNIDTSSVINMSSMFYFASYEIELNISDWNTSSVTDMSYMFGESGSYSTYPSNFAISNWDTSSVTSMEYMFFYNASFNQPLNTWDVSSVSNMSSMFQGAEVFNQPLNSWDTSSAFYMDSMFESAISFNQPLNNWDTSNVRYMQVMFGNAQAFDQDISTWNTTNVIDMGSMFADAILFNQPLNNWNTSNVTNMYAMFLGANLFNQPLNNWDTSKVTGMGSMFEYAISFNQPLNLWDVSKVNDFSYMFYNATAFNQSLADWNPVSTGFTNMTFSNFMANKTYNDYSTTNLDALYNSWSTKLPNRPSSPRNVMNFGTIRYTAASSAARTILRTAPKSYFITDGGITTVVT